MNIRLLAALLCVATAISIWLPAGISKDLLLVASGLLAGIGIMRSNVRVSVDASAEQERVLRNRLTVAMRAAGNEVWEFDFDTRQMVWLENRLPGIGLLDVPPE